MQTTHLVTLLVVLAPAVAVCGDADRGMRVNRYFELEERLGELRCECRATGGRLTCVQGTASDCRRDVYRAHEGELSEWLACAIAELEQREQCLREADCDRVAVARCLDGPTRCEAPSDRVAEHVERDYVEKCPEETTCPDTGAVRRNCDGVIDCADGLDEAFCVDAGTSGRSEDFVCDAAESIPARFECDGMQDCSDGSDEAHCPGPEDECVASTNAMLEGHVPAGCVECACAAALGETQACHPDCWALGLCLADRCDGSSEPMLASCAAETCGPYLGASDAWMSLADALESACATECAELIPAAN